MKYCIDCKHRYTKNHKLPDEIAGPGQAILEDWCNRGPGVIPMLCEVERTSLATEGRCGPKGKYWEPV